MGSERDDGSREMSIFEKLGREGENLRSEKNKTKQTKNIKFRELEMEKRKATRVGVRPGSPHTTPQGDRRISSFSVTESHKQNG